MTTKKIKITGLVASARRYNRLRFEIVEDDGSTTQVVYPRTRDGDDSLAVENGIFTVAQAIYFSASSPAQRLATAELYVNNQCCCCTKVHVEGVLTLSPVEAQPTPDPTPQPTPDPTPQPTPDPAPAPATG